ncbi:MAG: FtsW/RodA/SpoVE family cell cycle protein [Phycisphaeraceae bacterium]|nr:FtsW/RodA/SpoVE family cell cycle protein [Phycisphaeraceae bacterium]
MIIAFRNILTVDWALRHSVWLCVIGAGLLSLLGVYAIDLGTHGVPESGLLPITPEGVVLKQLVFLGVGVFAAAALCLPHYRWIRLCIWPAAIVVLGLLVFLLIPFVPSSIVRPRNGARAWIDLGVTDFQPAELAKIVFVLVMADVLRYRESQRTFLGLIGFGLIAAVPMVLISLQPDMGTALLFIPSVFAMLFVSGAKWRHLSIVVLCALLAAPAAYPFLKPYQKKRIVGLIQMMEDPRKGAHDINYQMVTARTLAGSGGVWGQPEPKARSLIRYNRLPERHNDMIFPIIVCRFGLAGAVLVGFLYALWFTGAYLTASLSRDPFARLVVTGLMAFIAGQAFVNIGMTIGLLPVVGVSLPFVSYGGSSMLSSWIMTGLIVNIGLRRQVRFHRPSFEFDPVPYDPDDAHLPQRIVPARRGEGVRA